MLCNSTTGFVFCVYLTYSSPHISRVRRFLFFCPESDAPSALRAHAGACKRAAQLLTQAYPACRMMHTADCGVVITREA